MKMNDTEWAIIFKALSNEKRLKIVRMIYESWKDLQSGNVENECCGGLRKQFTEACEQLNISRSTVSHHFKELEHAGIISCSREGQAFVCTINEPLLKKISTLIL